MASSVISAMPDDHPEKKLIPSHHLFSLSPLVELLYTFDTLGMTKYVLVFGLNKMKMSVSLDMSYYTLLKIGIRDEPLFIKSIS